MGSVEVLQGAEFVKGSNRPESLAAEVVYSVDACLKKDAFFHLSFFFILLFEIFGFIILFSPLADAYFLGVVLALFFFSVLFYFILRLYFEEEKPLILTKIRNDYLQKWKASTNYKEGNAKSHLQVAHALFQPVNLIQEKEKEILSSPKSIQHYVPQFFLIREWMHRQDLLFIKELFLKSSIDEHIKLVKCEPTNLEVHAALANAYVMLSTLYTEARQSETPRSIVHFFFSPSKADRKKLLQKFRLASERAIEEFTILKEYAPQDVWVHTQLAYSYRDLQMPEKEIEEYEAIMAIDPTNSEVLYKLGLLYFHMGYNAKGLQVYNLLKQANYARCEELIDHYGNTAS